LVSAFGSRSLGRNFFWRELVRVVRVEEVDHSLGAVALATPRDSLNAV
jgi:hypothetical protein